jgi:maltooligosyltrehalose trehalohydrolase
MGEEWGASTPFQFFSYFPGEQLREDVRRGRFEEFAEHGWDSAQVPDPNDEKTFLRSKLRWTEASDGWHTRLLHCYRSLITLRRAHPELTDPWLDHLGVDLDEQARWIVLHRGELEVALNLADEPAVAPLRRQPAGVLLSWSEQITLAEQGVKLAAEDFAVVSVVSA